MNWAQLRELDVVALPWAQVLVWPRRWQFLGLIACWALAGLLIANLWYWPQQQARQHIARQQAQQLAQRDQALKAHGLQLASRQRLAQALAALQPPGGGELLGQLEQLGAYGVHLNSWQQGGSLPAKLAFQGEWPAVYAALNGLALSVLWDSLTLELNAQGVLVAALELSRQSVLLASPEVVAQVTPAYVQGLVGGLKHVVFKPLASPRLSLSPGVSEPSVGRSTAQAPQAQAQLSKKSLDWAYAARRAQALSQPIASMQLLGVVQSHSQTVALVLAGGQVWRLGNGQRLGPEGLRVKRITPTALQLDHNQSLVLAGAKN